tara:strand:- start:1964 stop:2656 length:693 start_codon:yes stop_codon:yes gene_type:complete
MTKITILIPCYNEVGTIEKIVSKVLKSQISDKEIIIVDDCSNDGTREILKSKLSSLVNKILYHDSNLGKGACIRTGIQHVKGEIVIIQDADLEYDPNDYPKLIRPIDEFKADIVYGSRFKGSEGKRVLYFWNRVANYFLTVFSNICTNINLSDMETGFKCFKTSAIKSIQLKENGFGFEPEVTAKLAKKKFRFFEVGITYQGRTYEEGKKIRAIDGFKAVFCIVKYSFFD